MLSMFVGTLLGTVLGVSLAFWNITRRADQPLPLTIPKPPDRRKARVVVRSDEEVYLSEQKRKGNVV